MEIGFAGKVASVTGASGTLGERSPNILQVGCQGGHRLSPQPVGSGADHGRKLAEDSHVMLMAMFASLLARVTALTRLAASAVVIELTG